MKYVLLNEGRYYYSRRVPKLMKDYDKRRYIKIGLKTDSKDEARKRALVINSRIEQYWDDLKQSGSTFDENRFKQAVRIAQQFGFSYATSSQIAFEDIETIKARVKAADLRSPKVLEAVLGNVPFPKVLLSGLFEKFLIYSAEKLIDKSEFKVQKWKNPRLKAVNNFVALIGDKAITDVTRDNIIQFKDWWIQRIEKNNKNPASANKDLIHLKNMLETVSDNLKLEIDIRFLFKKMMFKKSYKQTRKSLSNEDILNILYSKDLEDLNDDAKWFLFADAETGARPAELVGLLPEDICINDEIPHIKIVDRKGNRLKTQHSEREIPLVGFALDAFKACPNGFQRYRNKPDSLTTYLNKFLRSKELLPSVNHSIYSLRHSFQERMLSVNAPDRIQAELMGHKFERPKYGEGGTLTQKLDWLNKIRLKTKEHSD